MKDWEKGHSGTVVSGERGGSETTLEMGVGAT